MMVLKRGKKFSLKYNSGVLDLSIPKIMGILNLTPDSFYDGGRYKTDIDFLNQIEKMINEGVDIIDIGAISTRPGSIEVNQEEELRRLIDPIEIISKKFPKSILSIDTYRSKVAQRSIEAGASMINDISGGTYDPEMFKTIAALMVPYIMMHVKGTPQSMQMNPQYDNVAEEIFNFFHSQLNKLAELDVIDNIVLDPGFGFGKTLLHNFQLLNQLEKFKKLNCPLLVGLSRKSMINKILDTKPEDALNGTSVLNTVALMKGVNILRVHDVKEAAEAIKLVNYLMTI